MTGEPFFGGTMIHNQIKTVFLEIATVLERINPDEMEAICALITDARTVFVTGAGRSGYMMRAFAMRLMHLGIEAYYIGDTTTPSAKENDVLIIGSGSGETNSLKGYAVQARAIGLKIALITGSPSSALMELADASMKIPAPTPKNRNGAEFDSAQPMANLFEQCLLITCDVLVLMLMEKKMTNASEMFLHHANLE